MKHEKADPGPHRLVPPAAVSRRRFLEAARAAGGALAFLVAKPGFVRAQATGEPLKIGCKGPFTGPASRTGDEIKNGVAMAIEDARADGDLPLVIDGEEREVEIVFIDSQSSPEEAVKAVTDAITRQGVQFIANGWHSSVAMALLDAEAPYNRAPRPSRRVAIHLREDQQRSAEVPRLV
jgi:branched-chain amino acid transport system substrate-binding protein